MLKEGLDDALASGKTPEDLTATATKELPGDDGSQGGRKSQASALVDVALASGGELFHDADGTPYLSFVLNGHRETHRLRDKGLRDWLAARYYAIHGAAPGSQALQDALTTLDGQAHFAGESHPVCVRLAGHDGAIYLDLGDAA